MLSKNLENPIIAVSVRVYQALLVAYPTKFQQEYGPHMLQVFRDCCLRTFHQSGTNGMARLWAITLFDLVQSLVSEHAQKEIEMKKEMKPRDIRMAGWALILGGAALAISVFFGYLGDRYWFAITGILTFICLPLLTVGMLGMRSRYGDQVGAFGKTVLLIGAILGPAISIPGTFLQGVGELWVLIFIGPIVQFICLVLFGLVGLYTKPLPRWNILPILAGFWLAIRWILIMIPALSWSGDDSLGVADAVFIPLQIASLMALGYILKSDVPEETPATA
ncbi:MAG TPA: hypothetical protein VJ972_10110 [Anaerolineales bacterium]|nr:hypothetical protein [Anaerolineales bacterium]